MTYRKKGGDWLEALQPPHMAEDDMVRGSIVDLDEDTSYEIRITGDNGKILAQEEFRTWRSDIPIAKTIVLDEATFAGQLTIRDEGSPDGWIKYTARKGFVLRNDRTGPLLELYKAKYVILEGLTLRGGLKDAVSITKCEHVRVVNCDIAGWGRIGTQRFDLDGKYYTENGTAINWDSAILVKRSTGTVVERCYIHDPVTTANSWYYSHPAGPQAVGIDKPSSTVIRYNDFIGSDLHRWNDAIEGAGNFHVDGGFNRDADIYGNLVCFANDDAVEIDGGQTNVRVFLNKFEGCLCGVSIQGCMSSPSYVFRNLLVNMGDENGVGGQTIKTSSFANGKSAVSFIFNNTCYGNSSDLSLPHNLRIVARNNIFAGRFAISGRARSPQSECDYNLLSTGEDGDEEHGILGAPGFVETGAGLFGLTDTSAAIGRGVAIANFATAEKGRVDMGAIPFDSGLVLPVRPIPVSLDRYQLVFSPAASAAARSRPVTATVNGEGFSSEYGIAQNDAFDWFNVSPHSGTLESGQKVTFTVTLVPDKMQNRSIFRGAFLIRLANGYSRPVMVYVETDVVPAVKPSREGVFVEYIEAETPFGTQAQASVQDALASGGACSVLSGDTSKGTAEYRFAVPKAGKYFVLMRIRSDEPVGAHDSVRFALDDGSLDDACLLSATSWGWSLVAHNRKQRLSRLQAFELSAGEHVLKLAPRESIYVDMIAVTDNPAMFD
ncbi:MAG: right-handed parallel beta-helix repeat-containing protein [Planctomycetota bacterium]